MKYSLYLSGLDPPLDKRFIIQPARQIVMSVRANFAYPIFIYGECLTEVCEAERNWRGKIQLTDWSTANKPVEPVLWSYKYHVIFVLVLSVICTLRSAVG